MAYLQETILPYVRDYSSTIVRKTFTSAVPQSTMKQLSNMRTDIVEPYIIQPLASLVAFSTTDIMSFFIMVITLYLSLRILDYARKVVVFWVMLVFRLAFWVSVIGLGFYVYNVGVARAVAEAGWFFGLVQGFIEDFMAKAESTRQLSNSAAGGRPQRVW
ncbi:hypothetical protein PISL3812_02207 [Talaromyces islandicus]|uniref:Uncharacterized protein n=1 Tax=Talaromyces islandicus TaxID=28573 RepID=A0A0U1LPJ0_TALIS|nr:hypothetical protein PISL3812_02207 [Talaromyces islandicus]